MSYLSTAVFAGIWAAFISSDCAYEPSRSCSRPSLLLIPVAGPWLVSRELEGLGTALFGVGQALGLVLTIAGAYLYGRSLEPRWELGERAQGLQLVAAPVPSGLYVGSSVRF